MIDYRVEYRVKGSTQWLVAGYQGTDRVAARRWARGLEGNPTVVETRITDMSELEAARRFVYADHDKPCKYGHLDCSNVTRGRCLDETLATYPEVEEA